MEKNEKINILQDLIRINSVNGNEQEVAEYIKQLFNKRGIEKTELIDFRKLTGRKNIVAEFGEATTSKVLALEGHMDTVAEGNHDNWEHAPFSAEKIGNSIYGRGAADMKSGLAAMVIAFVELFEEGFKPNGKLRFIGTACEELGAQGAVDLTQQGRIHDITAMVVGEPTGGNIVYAHSGQFDYHVDAYGKSAHSSLPDKGINAIIALNQFINAEQTVFNDIPTSPLLGPLVHSITTIEGGTQINSIPDYARLQGNIRPIPEFGTQQVLEKLQQIVKRINEQSGARLELKVHDRFEAIENDPNSEFINLVQRARTEAFGVPAEKIIIHGATDASAYVADNDNPKILLGAGEWSAAHQVNESVDIDQYLDTLETYKRIAKSYLAI